MQKTITTILLFLSINSHASNVIPIGSDNNVLYYKMGGATDFTLPPQSNTETMHLNTHANLGLGYSCSAFNPALSITNSMNDLNDSINNLPRDLIMNATASLVMMPMYELAKSNPTLYALLNNQLLSANQKLALSTKSCETMREQITRGDNPYHDWGTIAVNDQWKKKLSLAAVSDADINQAKKDIDEHSGDEGVNWVSGTQDSDGSVHAGGKSQPPVHVISDTVLAGYNVILNRDLQNKSPANTDTPIFHLFSTPQSAVDWITTVVGDQTITTCNSDECKSKQGSTIGQGLLPFVTSCNKDKENCSDTIRDHLANLVNGNAVVTKENIENVSADGIAMTPDAILSIRTMDTTQQGIIVNKLAQEVAAQRVIDKAFMAKNILTTGAQVPVIAANHPAEAVISHAIVDLDNDIRSLTFESQIRKQMMTDTVSQVLNYSNQQQNHDVHSTPVASNPPLIEDGAKKVNTP